MAIDILMIREAPTLMGFLRLVGSAGGWVFAMDVTSRVEAQEIPLAWANSYL